MRISFSRTCALVFALLSAAGKSPVEGEQSCKPLFNGKNLDGWIQRGGDAVYEVEDGAIVGKSVPNTPNSFLCTEERFGDFILELEVKVDPGLNSGIQIRSNSFSDYRNWRVHGYQVEVDPSDRAWSGGIYDEARRGWLAPLEGNKAAREAFKVNEWNTYRIQAIGDSLKTWVNGVPAAGLVDSMTLSGFIALQVHGTKSKKTKTVSWRNIRIKDLGRHYWKPIFDCATTENWHALPGGKWEVKDGMLVGTSPSSEHRHGILLSDAVYGDFTARLKFKALKGNSGFYFRSEPVNSPVGVHGFQAEIAAENDIGGLYETGGRGWVVKPEPEKVKKYFKPKKWNQMTVSAHGRRVVVHVNGFKTAELKDDPGRLKGRLGLQLHGGMDMHVQYKDIAVLEPEKPSDAVSLFNGKNLDNWQVKGDPDKSKWVAGNPQLSEENPHHLEVTDGNRAMVNLTKRHGGSLDIYSEEKFGDCRIELEVMVPDGSNSGIYVMGEYEIQILDSYGRKKLGQGDMGAVYGASPPPINASKKPGQWQKYVIDWKAPRFDENGKKVANAELQLVELNGHVLHHDLEMSGPTPGGVTGKEAPEGPLMFQGNHGPVAYRNIRVWPR